MYLVPFYDTYQLRMLLLISVKTLINIVFICGYFWRIVIYVCHYGCCCFCLELFQECKFKCFTQVCLLVAIPGLAEHSTTLPWMVIKRLCFLQFDCCWELTYGSLLLHGCSWQYNTDINLPKTSAHYWFFIIILILNM